MLSRTEHRGVCRLLSSVMSGTESHTDREEDYRFLHSMLMEKKLHLLFKIHERLKRFEKRSPIPVQEHAASLASDLAEELIYQACRDEVEELVDLFSKPNFKGLLSVHDAVAQRDFEPTLPPIPDDVLEEDEDSVKLVSLVKTKDPLGATIKKDKSTGAIVVARIMRGGAADKSGLIHEGDELKEVNGVSLEHRKPKEILTLLARSQGEVTFKIIPASAKEEMSAHKKLFMRALFDYDPNEDPTVPCKDAAVAFERGDVLQIVSMDDDTWWQACHLGDSNTRAGLIPSQQLHERRVALHRPKALFKPRRVKRPDEGEVLEDIDYGAITGIHIAGLRRSFRLGRQSILDGEAARSGRWRTGVHGSVCPPTYIEVIPYHRDPKERHRLVVLVGPSGVGVNELKRRLLISDPDHYGVTVPHTTREKRRQENEGVDYHFVSIHMFEEDILNNRFVEYGRYKGHYYGTSLDSVHKVMAEGKVCLLHVHLNKIKHVYTSEFKPYVVFVKPPHIQELRLTRRRAELICAEEDKNSVKIFSEEDFEDMINSAETMESQSGQLFDKVIVNGDIGVAFRELKAALEKVKQAEVQWIPAEWICSSPTKSRRRCGQLDSWI
ncbi:MAGUK p55 subfamily member 7-like isoform X1 [Etheostoma cragini]|uniref:MAGUK p55 subfamily member 7-like isoform X1 n=1 Tax=Etheostoma cragini TaxID=417921 RepID=UPI00155F2481|nr:MAGUK p55 subfamily member 7-like isoform X1 [Etheostoma cragini]XP_034743392.1 MAGUK p55 subfamily member 7-like isoform X1 [Etheostoma cragini]